MKKVALLAATGLTAACLNLPVTAQEFVDCNQNGLDNMKSQDQIDHVFFARLGNKGKGNGGESLDATFEATTGQVTQISCVSTATEETNGTLTVTFGGAPIQVIPESEYLPEIDPGKNQPRPVQP